MQSEMLTIDHVFKAPLDAVWQCWSQPEYFILWFAPDADFVVENFDFKTGGGWLGAMNMGDITATASINAVEIIPKERIVLELTILDMNGVPLPNPFSPSWPDSLAPTIRAVINFLAIDEGTAMNFNWGILDPTEEEAITFDEIAPLLAAEWIRGFQVMEEEALAISA